MDLFLAASWEPLIPVFVFVFFLLVSLIQRALQRSQRSDRSEPGGWDRSPEVLEEGTEVESGARVLRRYVRPGSVMTTPPVMPRPSSPWEEELEQVLQRRVPQPTPPILPPVSSPETSTFPEPQPTWEPVRTTVEHPIDHNASVEVLLMRNLESASTPSSSLSTAVESGERSISSINLEERVRKMMDRVGGQVRHMVPVTATSATSSSVRSPAGQGGWVQGLRNPTTARQAMLASLVLGRPRSLET
jgi:hypothetical protein